MILIVLGCNALLFDLDLGGGVNDVEPDFRNMGVKRYRTVALDRREWAFVMRKAKAKLKGL